MIPILYEEGTTNFNNNGIGRLSACISCHVEEKESGIYECEFKYPMTGIHYADIVEKRIVYCTHDNTQTSQPFEIYGRSAPHNGVVTFYAHHASYKLGNVILDPFSATSITEAFQKLKQKEINTSPFTYWTDKSSIGEFEIKVPTAVRAILAGVQGSILDVFGGGDYEWDHYTVKLWNDRGQDNNVNIRYGVNMLKMVQDTDDSSTFNAVAPFWYHEGYGEDDPEILVTIPEKIVRASSATSQTLRPITLDLSSQWSTAPTVQQLRDYSEAYMNQNLSWKTDENITVNFVALWQTEDYKDVAPLQRVRLYDYVHIVHDELGVNKKLQVVETDYNVLTERYDRMELGAAKQSFAEMVSAVTEEAIIKEVPTKSFMQQAIAITAETIRGNRGGYKLDITDADGHPMETLYMDAPNVEDAVNILRIGMSGIAFSNHGYDPETFVSAWDINGNFNANFITSGILNANLIKAGIISDLAGRNFWNLETGEFSLQVVAGETLEETIQREASSVAGYTLETPFTWSNNGQTANFTAIIYRGSSNVTAEFPDAWFVWTLRTEDGETQIGTGKTLSVNKSLFGYGATITCTFTTYETAAVLRSVSGAKLKSVSGKQMRMYANQDTDIIISDLPVKVASQVVLTEKLMGIDNVEGYQISIQEFSDVILKTVTNTINGQSQSVITALATLFNTYVSSDSLNTILNGYVLKSGDTMTGDLTIQKSASPMLDQRSSVSGRIDASALSANTNLGRIHRHDSNNEPVFYTETIRTTANQLYTSFIQRRYSADGSSIINHGFYLRTYNSGSLEVTFPSNTSRAAWVYGLFKSDNLTSNTTVSSNAWGSAPLQFRDSANTEIGTVGPYFWTNGQQGTIIRSRRVVNSETINNELHLRIGADGTRAVAFSDAVPWRKALGINNDVISVSTPSTISVPSQGSWANGTTLVNSGSPLSAGVYVVKGYATFSPNATGRRYTAIMTSNTGTSPYAGMYDSRMAVDGGTTAVNIFGIITLTAATTLYLRVLQTSGSALNCAGGMQVLKIH